jgi:hypothetical protein
MYDVLMDPVTDSRKGWKCSGLGNGITESFPAQNFQNREKYLGAYSIYFCSYGIYGL